MTGLPDPADGKGSQTVSRSLEIMLTPGAGAPRAGLDVLVRARGWELAAGAAVCRMPRIVVGIPGCAADRVEVSDDLGAVPVREEREPETSTAAYRRWVAERATSGPIDVRYFAPVRVVTDRTNNGPLFDLRAEAGGVSGAGICFLALPDTADDFAASISWDLSRLAPGARAVSTFGEGGVRTRATVEQLSHAYYMAGPVSSSTRSAASGFSMHWLSQPTFDASAVASQIERIYTAMCTFFREPEPGHRVFVRKHPYSGSGGTAFPRSFVFGYSEAQAPSVARLTSLVAHETAHNWPRLDGEHTETAWYSEGTAEYYSILLPYRAGITTQDEYLAAINERAHGYYTNPLQTLSNHDAGELFWKDNRAQRVPYGRGLFYLLDVNDQIIRRSGGTRSLDDLVLAILDRHRAGGRVGVSEWLELIEAELGEAGRSGYEAMAAGRWAVPEPTALGPRFTRREVEDHVLEVGFELDSLTSGTIAGLVEGSAAGRAGVREGDAILAGPNRAEIVHGSRSPIALTLRRGGEHLAVEYRPHGAAVRSYEWVRVP